MALPIHRMQRSAVAISERIMAGYPSVELTPELLMNLFHMSLICCKETKGAS